MSHRAKTPEQIRIKWIRQIEDMIGPLKEWPRALQNTMFKLHWNNEQRFKMIVFFTNNGLNPEVQKEFLATMRFDKSAIRQIEWIFKQFENGTAKWKSWNLSEKRTI